MLTVLLICCLVATAGGSAILFLALLHQTEEKRLGARIARVALADAPPRPGRQRSFRQIAVDHAQTITRLLGILGVDPRRMDDYPIRWWMVLILVAMLARMLTGLGGLLLGIDLGLLTPILAFALARLAFSVIHTRRTLRLFAQFPDALDTIVRCIRVGIPVIETLRIIARDLPTPTAVEFGRMADKVAIGVSLEKVLDALADNNDLAEYRFFATALGLQARTGGALAQTLETLADVIRKRVQTRERANALASEARSSAIVLAVLPILTAGIIWVLQPAYIGVLMDTASGRHLLALAIVLLGLGIGTMKLLIQTSLGL